MKKFLLLLMVLFCCQLNAMGGRQSSLHKVPQGSYLRQSQCGTGRCSMIKGNLVCTECVISPQERSQKTLFNPETCPVETGRFDIVNDSDRVLLKCLPRGSYLNSCGNCKMENGDLICQGCYLRTGESLQLQNDATRLNNVAACRYDIVNSNGRLRCLPQGPYLNNCDCVMVNRVLQCKCAASGQIRAVGLKNVDSCEPGTIRYTGDRLTCTPKRKQ